MSYTEKKSKMASTPHSGNNGNNNVEREVEEMSKAFDAACRANNLAKLRELCARKSQHLTAHSKKRPKSLLEKACIWYSVDVLKCLIEDCKADIDDVNKEHGGNLLHYLLYTKARERGLEDKIRYLVEVQGRIHMKLIAMVICVSKLLLLTTAILSTLFEFLSTIMELMLIIETRKAKVFYNWLLKMTLTGLLHSYWRMMIVKLIVARPMKLKRSNLRQF
jgi:hypothetical protein